MRVFHDTRGGWTTDEDYLELLGKQLPESARTIKPRGRLLLRPPRSIRQQVRRLVRAAGFEYIGMAKSDNERDWLIFRRLEP